MNCNAANRNRIADLDGSSRHGTLVCMAHEIRLATRLHSLRGIALKPAPLLFSLDADIAKQDGKMFCASAYFVHKFTDLGANLS